MDRQRFSSLIRRIILAGVFFVATVGWVTAAIAAEDDGLNARIIEKDNAWTLKTTSAQRTVTFADGKLQWTRFTDLRTRHELIGPGGASETFVLLVGPDRKPVGGSTGGWQLVKAEKTNAPGGEITLALVLQRKSVRHHELRNLPRLEHHREWMKVENAGSSPIEVSDPEFLQTRVNVGESASQQFDWMTGGENNPGIVAAQDGISGAGQNAAI